MKKIFIAAAIFLGIVVAAFFALSQYVNGLLDIKNIATLGEKHAGAAIQLKSRPEWSFFPPSITFSQLYWRNEANSAIYDVYIEKGSLTLDLLPLLRKKLILADVEIFNPACGINLKSDAKKSQPSPEDTAGGASSESADFLIRKMRISGGKFTLVENSSQYQLTNINLAAVNLALDKDINLQGDFVLAGNSQFNLPASNIALSANLKFTPLRFSLMDASITANPLKQNDGHPLSITAKLDGTLAYADLAFQVSRFKTEMEDISLSLEGKGQFSPLQFNGNFDFSLNQGNAEKASLPLMTLKGSLNYDDAILNIPDSRLSFLGNAGTGELTMNFSAQNQTPLLTGEIKFAEMTLPTENSLQTPGQVNESVNSQQHSRQPFSILPELKVNLGIDRLSWANMVVENIRLPLEIQNDILEIRQAEFEWAGGKSEAAVKTALKSGENELRVTGKNLEMGKALQELGIAGVEGGKANLSAHLYATGFDWTSIKSSLNGNAQLEGEDATIKVLQEIAKSLPAIFNMKQIIPEQIEKVFARCAANNGTLYCKPVTLSAQDVACDAIANLELSQERVNGTMQLKIGRANIPILFNGPLSDISWHPGSGFLEELRKLLP